MCKETGPVPHYPAFRPACFQQVGPKDDPALTALLVDYQGEGDDSGEARFRVRTPNVNLLTRVTLILQPNNGEGLNTAADDSDEIIDPAGDLPALWVASRMPAFGVSGSQTPPVRDVVATRPAPQGIPTNVGLWGFDFSLQTFGEELYGVLAIASRPLGLAQWRINVQYNSVERLSLEEWERARQSMGLDVEVPAIVGVSAP